MQKISICRSGCDNSFNIIASEADCQLLKCLDPIKISWLIAHRVERYLYKAFGDRLPDVRAAMAELSKSVPAADLNTRAFKYYEGFRPEVPTGERGWGAKGVLDLKRIENSTVDP